MASLSKLAGIGDDTAKTLGNNGVTDISQLLVYSPAKIGEMCKMDNPSVDKLFRKARAFLEKEGTIGKKLITGLESEKLQKVRLQIPTGCDATDKLFGGGIEIGETTEIYGEFGCGKTQFCHQMAVLTQKRFPDSKVIYMDSENTFITDRIRDIAESNDMSGDNCLENIIHAKAYNSSDQMLILEEVISYLQEHPNEVKLIVIDSATGLFRSEYGGRGMLSERQRIMGDFLTLASKTADHYQTAMIFTNQVMISPAVFYGDPVLAVGGTKLAHLSTHRVYFKKSGKKRVGKMVDSPRYAQTEVTFGLHKNGVVDPEFLEKLEKEAKAKVSKDKRELKKKTKEQLKLGVNTDMTEPPVDE